MFRHGKTRYIFPGSNTPQGYVSFYQQAMAGMEHIFLLKGGPGCGKSTLLRRIGDALLERGIDVEFWICSGDSDSLDGVVAPDLSLAVADATSPHALEPRWPGAVEELVDLGQFWDQKLLQKEKRQIIEISRESKENYKAAYRYLAKAGEMLREQQEAGSWDKEGLRNAADGLLHQLCRSGKTCRHFFGDAITPAGRIRFEQSIANQAKQRWLVQGPSGGRQELMRLLAEALEAAGHYAEFCHSPLQPENITLIYLPDLDCAVWDRGDSMEEAEGDTDHIIDCSSFCSNHTVLDPEPAERLIQTASANLEAARALHDRLERFYTSAMDFDALDSFCASLLRRILQLAEEQS